ncbi:FAD-dependent oxidoreductase [Streptomyces sp. NPDC056061]|uniref:FAD-dependent oxidoreductase n=1 Tax=Streptomyces sp. NPDC056061 TaxID=3345700 RepID=UPI0035D857D9
MRRALNAAVVGAGAIGAACAYYASRSGLSVAVVDRRPVASGTTGAGEGNLPVSDKVSGPELELALYSARLWQEPARELPAGIEYERRGGLAAAHGADGAADGRPDGPDRRPLACPVKLSTLAEPVGPG